MRPIGHILAFAFLFLVGTLLPGSTLADDRSLFAARRGIGVVQTFMFPAADPSSRETYAADPYRPGWNETMPPARLVELRQAGFDFLRIAIDPGPLLEADQGRRAQLVGQIEAAVGTTLDNGLAAVVDVHPSVSHPRWNFKRLTADPKGEAFARLLDVEQALARMLTRFDPARVALEVFNEPPPPCQWRDRPDWPDQLDRIVTSVRAVAPRLTLLVAGACWAAPRALVRLDPARFDNHTLFVFHFYEPFVFTHQGFWGSDKYLTAVPPLAFPPDRPVRDATIAAVQNRLHADAGIPAADRAQQIREASKKLATYFDQDQGPTFIDAEMDKVARWADASRIPRERIMLGEFGAMKDIYDKQGAPPADRARWIETTRKAAEQAGFRWSAWALTNTMGIVTGDLGGPLDPEILHALGLRAP